MGIMSQASIEVVSIGLVLEQGKESLKGLLHRTNNSHIHSGATGILPLLFVDRRRRIVEGCAVNRTEALNIPAEMMTSAGEQPCSAGTCASSPAGAFLIAVPAETSKAKTAGR
jgi:hypothetical protein